MGYFVRTAADSKIQHVEESWGSLTWLASKPLGNATAITVGRVTIKAGCANPRHSHSNCEEVLYLLRGTLVHTLGTEQVTLNAGDTLVVPPGVAHNATNIGEEDADMIVAYSSGVRMFTPEES